VAPILALAVSAAGAEELHGVLEKYIAWRGGSAFEAMESFHERGELRLGNTGGRFERWSARDGRMRRELTLGPITNVEVATATGGWTSNASGQVDDLPDDGLSDRRETLVAFKPDARRAGATLSLLPAERREGKTWAVLRVRFTGPDTYDLFVSASTGELFGQRITEDRTPAS